MKRILGYIKRVLYLFKMQFYRILYSYVNWGNNIKNYGYPIFRLKGKVNLANNWIFMSRTRNNFVGISKEYSIYVLENVSLTIGNNFGFSGVSNFCTNSIDIIGEYFNFEGDVSIWDADFHPLDYDKIRDKTEDITTKPIIIKDNVFIRANSLILKGITIGEKAIIRAGSVVTKDISANEIWAGNPAKFIKII